MALILFVPGIMQRTLSPQRLGSLFDHINGILVSSLLRSSRPDEALKAISEWRRMRTDTSALDRVQRAVESFPRDPDAAISELRRFTPVPDLLAE
jgi:hypothetical protein